MLIKGSYISGSCGVTGQPACPNTTQKYQHDFGSILAFTEFNFQNFGLGFIDQSGAHGYADQNALDTVGSNTPLSDFFPLYNPTAPTPRSFFQIPVSPFPANFFESYYATHSATPTGPDPD